MGPSARRPQRARRCGHADLPLDTRRVTATSSEILFERRGTAGLVTLNRPQALNAVSLVMVRALRRQLDAWRNDPAITRVVLAAAGERAFSAGGDLRQVYELGRTGRQDEALVYWR